MKRGFSKKLILSLIRDDIRNSKLVDALGKAGLNANGYYLDLSDTIFIIMGIDDSSTNEVLYEKYINLTRRAQHIDVSCGSLSLNRLTLEVYFQIFKNSNSTTEK